MEYSSSADILAAASQFGDDLKTLADAEELPRDILLRYLRALQNSFASLQAQIASGLDMRDRLVARIDAASDEMNKMAVQVKAMGAELRALQARVEQREGPGDRYAGRH